MLEKNSVVECERDSYKLLLKIRTGGMGVVWEALSTTTDKHVIIKEPLINGDHDHIKIERLLSEAALLQKLNDERSPVRNRDDQSVRIHVVRFVDQLPQPDHPLLVLERVEGPSLNVFCRANPLDEQVAMQYAANLLKVVSILHSRRVIHRDISPGNIILSNRRGPVLIDFGTSMMLGDNPQAKTAQVVFKRGYSAPELIHGLSDVRSDIFSLGATLFFALTGREPGDFMAGSEYSLRKPPHMVNEQISPAASEIIQKALSPKPDGRFQTTPQMLDAIQTEINRGRGTRSPRILLSGVVYEINKTLDIGRAHLCDGKCKSQGFKEKLKVQIPDTAQFIEKHHARIWTDESGNCYVEDLKTTNGTAICPRGRGDFQVIAASRKEKLQSGDIVALAFNPNKGPYVTFVFNPKIG